MAANARVPPAESDVQNEFTQAAANGNLERLRELSRDPGVQVNGRNRYGRTAIQVMIMSRPDVAEFLLQLRANPNEPDRDVGRTPLHDAAEHGHEETVELLLRHGADPMVRDKYGNTPVHLAGAEGRSERILESLSRGCTLRETNSAGRTPYDEAISNNKQQAAQWIANYHSSGEGTKLLHLCRLTIHRAIGTQRMPRMRELAPNELPNELLEYLKMSR